MQSPEQFAKRLGFIRVGDSGETFGNIEDLQDHHSKVMSFSGKSVDESQILSIEMFPRITSNADLYTLTVREHREDGRPVEGYKMKVSRNRSKEALQREEAETKMYDISNDIKDRLGPGRTWKFAGGRHAQMFPRYYPDNTGTFQERGIILLEDLATQTTTLEEIARTRSKISPLHWETFSDTLAPAMLLFDFFQREWDLRYNKFRPKAPYSEYYTKKFMNGLNAMLNFDPNDPEGKKEGILVNPRQLAPQVAHLFSKQVSFDHIPNEERYNLEQHPELTTVKEYASPSSTTPISLIDASDIVLASRLLHIGGTYGHKDVWTELSDADKPRIANDIYRSYLIRREDLKRERNVSIFEYEIDEANFALGFHLCAAYANITDAYKLLNAYRERKETLSPKQVKGLISRIGKLREVVLGDEKGKEKGHLKFMNEVAYMHENQNFISPADKKAVHEMNQAISNWKARKEL